MYCSKLAFTVRISASDSWAGAASSAIFSTVAWKKSLREWKPVTRARALPSTSTRTVWSGSFSSCSTVARVPMVCRPSAVGSSSAAFFWVRSRICFSSFITSSRARTDFSRPTNRGTIMCGKTTMSRSGRTGALTVRRSGRLSSWWRHPPYACSCRIRRRNAAPPTGRSLGIRSRPTRSAADSGYRKVAPLTGCFKAAQGLNAPKFPPHTKTRREPAFSAMPWRICPRPRRLIVCGNHNGGVNAGPADICGIAGRGGLARARRRPEADPSLLCLDRAQPDAVRPGSGRRAR